MAGSENRKEPKRKFALWIRESTLDSVKKIYAEDNCASQSEFIVPCYNRLVTQL